MAAGELRAGDALVDHTGRPVVIDRIDPVGGEHETVYNLTVEGCHTYFVGAEDWYFSLWVHNGGPDGYKTTTTAGLVTQVIGDLTNLASKLASVLGSAAKNGVLKVGESLKSQKFGVNTFNAVKQASVYIFRDANEVITYIGKSKNLVGRIRDHFSWLKSAKGAKVRPDVETVEYIALDTVAEAEAVEALMIKNATQVQGAPPKYNKMQDGGSKLPWN